MSGLQRQPFKAEQAVRQGVQFDDSLGGAFDHDHGHDHDHDHDHGHDRASDRDPHDGD